MSGMNIGRVPRWSLLIVLGAVVAGCNAHTNRSQFFHDQLLQTHECQYCDLRYNDFSERDLKKINLSGSYLYGANFSWSQMTGSILVSSSVHMARFEWTDCDECDLSKASLEDAIMFRASLKNANLQMANLSRANLTSTELSNADMLTAVLENAILIDARLANADLRNANLRHSDMSGARLSDADLQGALLDNANMQGADFTNANLSNSSMSNVNFSNTYIYKANLRNVDLRDADFRAAQLDIVNLQGADLRGADFTGATFKNVTLFNAVLCGAIMPDGETFSCDEDQAGLDSREWNGSTTPSKVKKAAPLGEHDLPLGSGSGHPYGINWGTSEDGPGNMPGVNL